MKKKCVNYDMKDKLTRIKKNNVWMSELTFSITFCFKGNFKPD